MRSCCRWLGERLHDNRFLRLLKHLLEAGYLEEWRYGHTLCCESEITSVGNNHGRRVLVESAWNYRHPPRVGVRLRRRR